MSIIAVGGIPFKWTRKSTVKMFAKAIKAAFELLNFDPKDVKNNLKTVYIRLPEKLDPQLIIQRLNNTRFPGCQIHAFLPSHVPDLPLATKNKKKLPPAKLQQKSKAAVPGKPAEILTLAHGEILCEMQYKYTGLFELSNKNGHTLLEEITHTLFERLKLIMDTNPQAATSPFYLTKSYRRAHPHFADFQLILSTHQSLQQLAGARAQLTEQEISVVNTQPCLIGNIPYKKVKSVCTKYTDVIVKEVSMHVSKLDCEINTDQDTEEEIAKKKVRVELKKLTPYLSTIIREVITENFVPERSPYHRFRIYGEPFLPPKETMSPFLNRYRPVNVSRSDRMYNLLKMYISLGQYGSIMAMDGTVVGGAKLVIRPSEQRLYKLPDSFVKEMRAAVSAGYKPGAAQVPEKEEEEQGKTMDEWNDPWE